MAAHRAAQAAQTVHTTMVAAVAQTAPTGLTTMVAQEVVRVQIAQDNALMRVPGLVQTTVLESVGTNVPTVVEKLVMELVIMAAMESAEQNA